MYALQIVHLVFHSSNPGAGLGLHPTKKEITMGQAQDQQPKYFSISKMLLHFFILWPFENKTCKNKKYRINRQCTYTSEEHSHKL